MDEEERIKEEDLEEVPTFNDKVERMLILTNKILVISGQSPLYDEVNALTEEIDQILIEMRHGNWLPFVG